MSGVRAQHTHVLVTTPHIEKSYGRFCTTTHHHIAHPRRAMQMAAYGIYCWCYQVLQPTVGNEEEVLTATQEGRPVTTY